MARGVDTPHADPVAIHDALRQLWRAKPPNNRTKLRRLLPRKQARGSQGARPLARVQTIAHVLDEAIHENVRQLGLSFGEGRLSFGVTGNEGCWRV